MTSQLPASVGDRDRIRAPRRVLAEGRLIYEDPVCAGQRSCHLVDAQPANATKPAVANRFAPRSASWSAWHSVSDSQHCSTHLLLDHEHALDLGGDVAQTAAKERGPLVEGRHADRDVDRLAAIAITGDADCEVTSFGRVCRISKIGARACAPLTKSLSSVDAAHRDCSAFSGWL